MDYNQTHSHETIVMPSIATSHGWPQAVSTASEVSEFLTFIIEL